MSKLVAVRFTNGKDCFIEFIYSDQRWMITRKLRPWDVREVLRVCLEEIEEAVPGCLEKASVLDDKDWMDNTRRTRRYIAERQDLLYIDSPHLQSQSELIAGYYVVTNILWRDVSVILRLVCSAACIEFHSKSITKLDQLNAA